jgi:outer membrane protein
MLRAMVIAAIVGAASVATVGAQDEDSFRIRFGGVYVNPTGDLTTDVVLTTLTVEPDSAAGLDLGFEFLVNEKIGIDVGVSSTDHDLDGTVLGSTVQIGSVGMMPVTVGANLYFGDHEKFDFYLTPFVSWVLYDDIELESALADEVGADSIATKDDVGFGIGIGFDVPLGEGAWALSTGLDYTFTAVETDEPGDNVEIDVDPWSVRLGVAYTF